MRSLLFFLALVANTLLAAADLPSALPVPGKPGYVTSPHAPNAGQIDLRGFPAGTEVKCPYTGKIFVVPREAVAAPANSPGAPVYSPGAPREERAGETIPVAAPAPGKPGFVLSPFSEAPVHVDVKGMPPGAIVKCPFTGKPFRVP